MERISSAEEPSRSEQNQGSELGTTIPSYGFLSFFAKHCLPYEGYGFSITQRAEDLDESPEKIINAIEAIHQMKALQYLRNGDYVTIISKNSNNVTPGAYYKVFPNSNPVNPVDVGASTDPLFDDLY